MGYQLLEMRRDLFSYNTNECHIRNVRCFCFYNNKHSSNECNITNHRLNVQNYTNNNVINTTVNNYQLIVSEDLSLNGCLFVSSDASLNGNLYVNDYLLVNTISVVSNSIVNINGNMYQSNGCIFQF